MQDEIKICQNCKQGFEIDVQDFDFYKKMDVPPPTWCPDCRMMRRLAFTNIQNLYKRSCAKCAKSIISIYSPDKPMSVYCLQCWWADSWDGTEYAMDYDSSRPFLEQVKELAKKTPWQAFESQYLTIENSEYCNAVAHLKNCYLIFWADYCENVFYSRFLNKLKDSLDCYRMKDSELCYGDVGCNKCYRTFFSEECDSCSDVWFSRNCAGCTNCFGCINLRNKNYCIFNEQYSKEDYIKKIEELRPQSFKALAEIKKQTAEFWSKHPRRVYTGNSLNFNVSGDYIYESKNAKDCYMVSGVENSRYIQFISVAHARDCYDYSGWGNGAEQIYDSGVIGEGTNNVKFSNECFPDILNAEYSIYAISSKNIFGCVNLKRKEYCVLNKQYSKEDYEKLVAQIKEDMVKNPYKDSLGRIWPYGEFLPLELSPFAYNETIAQEYFPKTKEEAIIQGFSWYEEKINQYPITISGNDIPDIIVYIDESITKETIGCAECNKAFRVTPNEFNLMRKLNLPLPHSCPNCRQKTRFPRTNLPKLYNRICNKCNKPISTSYSPDRPEIIYCEQCYQAEVA
ncbi:MAG: hypothetical protein Q7K44_01495 [Candidatus Liptonbacteria bacterium]|nr:hypothetical protein [Candidatus Liptonbacteria bacterium]